MHKNDITTYKMHLQRTVNQYVTDRLILESQPPDCCVYYFHLLWIFHCISLNIFDIRMDPILAKEYISKYIQTFYVFFDVHLLFWVK